MGGVTFGLLVLYLFVVIIRPHDYPVLDFSFPVVPVVESILILAWIASSRNYSFSTGSVLLGVLTLWIGLSAVFVDVTYGLEQAADFFLTVTIVCIIVAQASRSTKRARQLMLLYAILMAVIALHCLLQFYDADRTGWSGMKLIYRYDGDVWQPVYAGTLDDPNDLGSALCAAVPMLFYFLWSAEKRTHKLFFLSLTVISLWTIFILNSRGTYVAAAVTAFAFIVLRYGLVRFAFAIVPLVIIAIPLMLKFAPTRMFISGDDSALSRVDAWYGGLKFFSENPLLGIGKDTFITHHERASHNSWIEILAETGLVGYLLWNAFILGGVVTLYQLSYSNLLKDNVDQGLLRALFMSLVAVCASVFFVDRAYIIFTFLLVAIANGQIARHQAQGTLAHNPALLLLVCFGAFCSILVVYITINFLLFV